MAVLMCMFYGLRFVLFFRVLRLMDLTDSKLPQSGCEKLEIALISFFEQFRKIYIGDQVQKTSRVSGSDVLLLEME